MPVLHFFFNDAATTEIYTLSLHDALPIYPQVKLAMSQEFLNRRDGWPALREAYRLPHADVRGLDHGLARSEEHTSELQSQSNLVCRLLLEKKKQNRRQSIRQARLRLDSAA